MTVATSTSRVSYAGNGSTHIFTVPFYFLDNTHLRVILRSSLGVETTLVYVTNYSVTGAGVPAGGTINIGIAPASGETVTIIRSVPATQLTDYVQNDPFPAESHERALDKLTMLAQQLSDSDGRALRLYESDTEPGGRFNARANRITNLINLTTPEASEAITYGFLGNYVASILSGGTALQAQLWTFTGDNVTTVFALPASTLTEANLYTVTLDGLDQRPTTDYTITGSTAPFSVTFGSAPGSNVKIMVRAMAVAQTVTIGAFDASAVVSGVFAPGRLGSGSADASKFLRGDSSWSDTLQGPLTAAGGLFIPGLLSTNLGAGSMTVAGTMIANMPGSNINSGLVAPQFLGSGVADSSRFLRGDGQWSVPPASGGGALPVGGLVTQFLRGDGVWSSTMIGNMQFDVSGYDGVTISGANTYGLVVSGANPAIRIDSTSNAGNWLLNHREDDNSFEITHDNGSVESQRLHITAAGLVGINNDTPTERLHVSGNILATGTITGSIAASSVNSGVLGVARLGTGSADATKFLRGDGSWQALGVPLLGAIVDDPIFGVGAPGNSLFYRGDGKWASVTNTALGVKNYTTNKGIIIQQLLGGAEIYSSDLPFTSYFPITSGSAWGFANAAGALLGSNDADDRLQANGRIRSLRNRTVGSEYRNMVINGAASGAITCDANDHQYFKLTIVGNTTLTFSDGGTDPSASGEVFATEFALELIGVGASVITWPGSVVWASGNVPTLASSGSNLLYFVRRQGVAGHIGYIVNQAGSGGSYTDEQAQDAVGGIMGTPTATIALTYSDATPSITADLRAGSVTSGFMAANSIASAAIQASAVTTAKIADANVTTIKIADANVTTAKIADANVTIPKIGASGTANNLTFLRGDGSWAVPPSGASGSVIVQDEGADVMTATRINFAGAGVTATLGFGGVANITIPGGGGGGGLPGFAGASKILATNLTNDGSLWTNTPAGGFTWGGQHNWFSTSGSNTTSLQHSTADNSLPSFALTHTCQPSNDRSGGLNVFVNRTGGQTTNANFFFYSIQAPVSGVGIFDIGLSVYTQARNVTGGGTADCVWLNGMGPANWFAATPDAQGKLHNYSNGIVRIGECNYGNAWADLGLVETRGLGGYYAGLEFFPAWLQGDCGGTIQHSYNVQWAIAIGAAAPSDDGYSPKHWTGILMDRDSIQGGGYGLHIRGGSTATQLTNSGPGGKAIKLNDYWITGLDTSAATFTGANAPAITLATDQRIHLGGGVMIWSDGTDLYCSSPSAGTKRLLNF